jgi:hypothetical protein
VTHGILFGLAFVGVAVAVNRLLPDAGRRRAMMALLLVAAAAVYVGSSLGDLPGSAGVQTLGFLVFAGVALRGFDTAHLLAAGWLGHALWDLLHLAHVITAGVPEWYQVGCLVADPALAGYIMYALRRPAAAP